MKKFFLAAFCFTALFFGSESSNAQTGSAFKIGIFDIDLMVRAMPEYRRVDSLTQLYETDTLGTEYQIYQNEYRRLDSTLRADSAKSTAKTIMDYNNQQKQQMTMNLVYWQQIAQNKSDQYRGNLAAPLYQRVITAYKKVLAAKKYNLILKPDSYEVGTPAENMFPLVAKEMGVTLPQGLMGDPNQALNDFGTGAATGGAAAKP